MDQFHPISYMFIIFYLPACPDCLNKCRCIVAVIFVSFGNKACLLAHLSTQPSPISMGINDLVVVFFLLSRCQKPTCWDLTNSFFGGESEVDTILWWFFVMGCLVDWWIRSIISTEASHFPLCCEASRPTWVHYVLLADRNDGGGKDDRGPTSDPDFPDLHSPVLSEACPSVSGRCTLIGCDDHSKIYNPLCLIFFIEAVLSHGPSQTQTAPFARVHLFMQGNYMLSWLGCKEMVTKTMSSLILHFRLCSSQSWVLYFKIPIVTFSWWRKWVSPVGQIWNLHPQIQRSVIVKRWLLPSSCQQYRYSQSKDNRIRLKRHSFSGFGGAFPQHCAKGEAGMAGHGVAGGDHFHFEVLFLSANDLLSCSFKV